MRGGATEHLVERGGEAHEILLLDDERGEDLDDVHVVAGDLGEDPVLAEQRDRDELSEQTGLACLHHVPQPPPRAAGGRTELERPHQPQPAHLTHDLVALHQRPGELQQPLPECARALDEAGAVELLERGEAGDGGEVVAGEGRAVHDRALHRVEHAPEHRPTGERRADRDVATGERLRDGHDVGIEIPVFEREQASRAPEPGLDLVHRQQRPVAAAELLGARQVAGRGDVHALALHGLDQECGDVATRELARQRVEVAEGHGLATRQQRPGALAVLGVAVDRQRSQRQAVEAALAEQHALPAGGHARELQRRLDRLRPGVREHGGVDPLRHPREQFLGEQAGGERDAQLREVGRPRRERLRECVAYARIVTAEREHPVAAEQVEVTIAARVDQLGALGGHPTAVEVERAQHPPELRVEVPVVQRELLPAPLVEQAGEIRGGRRGGRFAAGHLLANLARVGVRLCGVDH
jgi:hypothetical protein